MIDKSTGIYTHTFIQIDIILKASYMIPVPWTSVEITTSTFLDLKQLYCFFLYENISNYVKVYNIIFLII